jgi:hypothetical protein
MIFENVSQILPVVGVVTAGAVVVADAAANTGCVLIISIAATTANNQQRARRTRAAISDRTPPHVVAFPGLGPLGDKARGVRGDADAICIMDFLLFILFRIKKATSLRASFIAPGNGFLTRGRRVSRCI